MDIRIWSFVIVCLFLLAGCQNTQNDAAKLEEENQDTNHFVQIESPTLDEAEDQSNTKIANHLAEVASNVPEVNQASALVAGPYTVVAIDIDAEIDRSRVGSIKYSVSEALYHDPWGKTAVVVADPDLMARFRDIGDRIEQGHPVQGVVDELSAIVGRVIPEFPVQEDQPIESEDNKEILDEEKEEQLDDIQDEQSNHER